MILRRWKRRNYERVGDKGGGEGPQKVRERVNQVVGEPKTSPDSNLSNALDKRGWFTTLN